MCTRGGIDTLLADIDAIRLFYDAIQNRKDTVLFKRTDMVAGDCRNNSIFVIAMTIDNAISIGIYRWMKKKEIGSQLAPQMTCYEIDSWQKKESEKSLIEKIN